MTNVKYLLLNVSRPKVRLPKVYPRIIKFAINFYQKYFFLSI